ncbi:glycoside hydrolase family 26 protein [Ciceribacter azotifigens]|uniref:glycoside hydrolase family 26 protein n=1 Tax=Ciceribacter azotifigens TaxID=2069303 RepID=UPI003A86DEDE
MRVIVTGLISATAFALGLLVFCQVQAQPEAPPDVREAMPRIALGVYDPHSEFSSENAVDIEHIFVYWQALDMQALKDRMAYARQRGRDMIVTVEPYTKAANWRDGGERLFSDITAGKFDAEIDTLCSALNAFDGRLFIRWGQEMEDPTGRYPWARDDSNGYKSAYRYFVDSCRGKLPEAEFIWSPKGLHNLADYYPGDAYVDYIGLAVWGNQGVDRDRYGGERSFEQAFEEKYDRVARFGKPVYIAELGVAGEADYRSDWLRSLYESILEGEFGLLRGVIYFNDEEPHQWPMDYGSPDWRIQPGWFSNAPRPPAAEDKPAH